MFSKTYDGNGREQGGSKLFLKLVYFSHDFLNLGVVSPYKNGIYVDVFFFSIKKQKYNNTTPPPF